MQTYKLEIHGVSPRGDRMEIIRHLECESRHEARVICYDLIVIERLSEATFQVDEEPEGNHWISVGVTKRPGPKVFAGEWPPDPFSPAVTSEEAQKRIADGRYFVKPNA